MLKVIKNYVILLMLFISYQSSSIGAQIGAPEPFSFIVFGDFNGGGCDRNVRVGNIINDMAAEEDIAFYISTGDIIDGFGQTDGSTSCFASDPSSNSEFTTVCSVEANLQKMMAPIKDRPAVPGLEASFYPVIGNHDDNWYNDGINDPWYPDPCGDGICDFLSPFTSGLPDITPETYIKHPHGDICDKTSEQVSAHSRDFYYSFTYQNNYFIILRVNNDYHTMVGAESCNIFPSGYVNCTDYCSDTSIDINERKLSCWGGVEQYDWLLAELDKASTYNNIFVFSHAVGFGTGQNHFPYSGSEKIREVIEAAGADIYFNGHNHAYERSFPLYGSNEIMITEETPNSYKVSTSLTENVIIGANEIGGTVYITTGVAGALFDYNDGGDFTAATYEKWYDSGQSSQADQMASYTKITVLGDQIKGDTYSKFTQAAAVDSFVNVSDTDGDGVFDTSDNCMFAANVTQTNADSDVFGNACDPDLNNDLVVNSTDLQTLIAQLNSNNAIADLNGDNIITGLDYAILRSYWNNSPGPVSE